MVMPDVTINVIPMDGNGWLVTLAERRDSTGKRGRQSARLAMFTQKSLPKQHIDRVLAKLIQRITPRRAYAETSPGP